ncbi:uncharacterized protein VICG_01181 [Vittaforma corneae ATCC 50505]|uniref:Uncharacterized protein n=1 Tax=Vittaforma corneae (strain ATCC 50505) TaxID=993615 RepID=L2GMG3_VITCO|nr:uncharacterized protein VICG_01181 [Vittaforma corneae ATCC 50505]ELA41829.1 hypothetical protein VICG_01181 [Vittaforma corneae ATCC 50505]
MRAACEVSNLHIYLVKLSAQMNIRQALDSSENILKTLKKFPKHSRCPHVEERYPRRVLVEAHTEILRKCLPLFAKITKEAKAFVQNFDQKALENVASRKEYIESKIAEARSDFHEQTRKNKIISEIESLEKVNIQKFERLVVDEAKSAAIIDYIFESCEECSGLRVLENFIELTYDRNAGERTDSYEKILQLL